MLQSILGEFGIVYEAQLKDSKEEKNTSTLVAVKTLKSNWKNLSVMSKKLNNNYFHDCIYKFSLYTLYYKA